MHNAKFIINAKKIFLGLSPFLVILCLWQGYVFFYPEMAWLIPSPSHTAQSFVLFVLDGTLVELLAISLSNLIPPFFIALLCATGIGTLMGVSKEADQVFYPFLSALNPIPSIAWLPFVMLFLGFSWAAIWVVIFISTFLKMIYAVRGGVQGVDIHYILLAKNLGFNKRKIITDVFLPCSLPQFITGIRISFGSAWRSLIGAEMLVVTLGGLGKYIWLAQWYFNFDKVIIGIVVIGVVGIIVEELFLKKVEKNTISKWGLKRGVD